MKGKLRILSFKIPVLTLEDKVQDSIDVFRELGHEVKILKIPDDGRLDEKALEVEIEKFFPDFIFTVDRQGIIPELLHSLKVPYVSWFGTDPFIWINKFEIPKWVSPYGCVFVCERCNSSGHQDTKPLRFV